MSERKYDPAFSDQFSKRVTIEDVARDHSMRWANCGCSICWAAKMVAKIRDKKVEAAKQAAITERWDGQCPTCRR